MNELEEIRRRKRQELINKTDKKQERANYPDTTVTITDADFDEMTQNYPLMVVDCWAAWCGPCKRIAPIIDELAKDYAGRAVFGKLNTDENMGTVVRFKIMSIPTLLIIKNGKESDRIIGAVPRQVIEAKLERYF